MDEWSEISARLADACSRSPHKQRVIAKDAELSEGALSLYINPQSGRKPSLSAFVRLIKTLGVSADYVLGLRQKVEGLKAPGKNGQITYVPLVRTMEIAGQESFADEDIVHWIAYSDFCLMERMNGEAFEDPWRLVEVHPDAAEIGDSMAPLIRPGARVLIDRGAEFENGAAYLVRAPNGVTVRRVYENTDTLSMIAENPSYPPESVPAGKGVSKALTIIGKVVCIHQCL